MPPPIIFFPVSFFWIFSDLHFAECFSLPSVFWHSAKALPSARQKALGKDVFADEIAAECPLPSVTLGKAFAECNRGFAECLGHSAKPLNPVVQIVSEDSVVNQVQEFECIIWLHIRRMSASSNIVMKYFISDQLLYSVNDVINHPRAQLQGISCPLCMYIYIYVNNPINENHLRTLTTLVICHSLYFYSTTRYHACMLYNNKQRKEAMRPKTPSSEHRPMQSPFLCNTRRTPCSSSPLPVMEQSTTFPRSSWPW
jgi:hypothetical protein